MCIILRKSPSYHEQCSALGLSAVQIFKWALAQAKLFLLVPAVASLVSSQNFHCASSLSQAIDVQYVGLSRSFVEETHNEKYPSVLRKE